MAKIVRVNMSNKNVVMEPVPEKYKMLGGRSLIGKILLDEIDPECDPLGEFNKLIIAPGLLGGTRVSTSGRLSIGAKSPLTGGIKEANTGGVVGRQLAKLGIKAIIIEGIDETESWRLMKIDRTEVTLEPCPELLRKGNYEVMERLKERYGKKVGMISIGQAGEMLLRASAICFADMDGMPNRQAARGGLGSVMGSKRLKAIVIDDTDVHESLLEMADEKGFNEIAKAFNKDLTAKKVLTELGTAFLVKPISEVGALPYRNFSKGSYDKFDQISGERMAELIKQRGGKTSHPCQPGCVIRCSNVFNDSEGNYLISSIEYETIGLLGSNLDIDDLDSIARMNRMCNDYGVDTIDIGCALGVAVEAGLFKWGDAVAAEKLVEEIGKGTVVGRLIGSGAEITGKALGVRRIPTVKGQSFAAYDPRGLKGTGTTYATCPMGADHTAGNLILGREGADPKNPAHQKVASRNIQIYAAVIDAVGCCVFIGTELPTMEIIAKLLTTVTGQEVSTDNVIEMGKNIIKNELEFNRRAGFTSKDDRLPEFVRKEKIDPNHHVFDVIDSDLEGVFGEL